MASVTSLTRRAGTASRARSTGSTTTRICLLGPIRALSYPDGINILPASRKTQAVFAYLCLAPGERLLRSRIAGLIWDRSTEKQARDSLRHALNELTGIGGWRLETDHETVCLDIASCWIDAFDSPAQSDRLLEDLYGISASFDQWLVGERVRFENHWLKIMEDELDSLTVRNEPPKLKAAAARKILNFVPAHEIATRGLMAAFVELGDRAQAIREFERFRRVLNTGHGIRPSETTTALYNAICLDSRVKSPRPSYADRREIKFVGPTQDREPLRKPIAPGTLQTVDEINRPSIAVLPFRNLSGGADYDYIAEGLTEDLVEALSRVPSVFVISRLSSAAFRSQDRPPLEIGEALGVRYILSGSIRLIDDRLCLMAELMEPSTGAVLWVSRFDEKIADWLNLQHRLAETVIRSIAPHVRSAELKRVQIKRPEDQGAYDLILQAQECMHHSSRAVFESAERLFDLAIARGPETAVTLAWRAYWHVMRVGQGWSPDPAVDTAQADEYAKLAVEHDPVDPMALAVRGHVATYLHKDFDLAFGCFEIALQTNPNSARAWLWNANAHAYLGDGNVAVEKVERALSLSPYDPLAHAYSGGASLAYLADDQYERAIECALRSIRENRGYTSAYKLLAAACSLAGHKNEARAAAHRLLLLEPRFTVREHRRRFPGGATAFGERYCEALAAAGVPLLG